MQEFILKKKISHSAFSLIEVLVVLTVLGILTAIITHQYQDALQRASQSACQQNLRTIFHALHSYRMDFNRFPPADGVAGTQPAPNDTIYGCGPAASGYWSGVSLLLVKYGYCSEQCLFCPTLKKQYNHRIAAYPSCRSTDLGDGEVPRWQFLRYAYNSAATDAGGYQGGEHDLERHGDKNIWLVRCLHLDVAAFDPDRAIQFPHRLEPASGPFGRKLPGEYELTIQGSIRVRRVQN